MRIIGLDPGLRHTGYGIIETDGNKSKFITAGTISAPTEGDMDKRLLYIYTHLNQVLQTHQCNLASMRKFLLAKILKQP